jgi:hypothetical protein
MREDLSLLRYGLLQKCSRLLQKRKEKKKQKKKERNKGEREVASGERREKNCVFSQPLPSEIGGSFVVRS